MPRERQAVPCHASSYAVPCVKLYRAVPRGVPMPKSDIWCRKKRWFSRETTHLESAQPRRRFLRRQAVPITGGEMGGDVKLYR